MITCKQGQIIVAGVPVFNYYKGADLYFHFKELPKVAIKGNINDVKCTAARIILERADNYAPKVVEEARNFKAPRANKSTKSPEEPMSYEELIMWKTKVENRAAELMQRQKGEEQDLIKALGLIERMLSKCGDELTEHQSNLVRNMLKWAGMMKRKC